MTICYFIIDWKYLYIHNSQPYGLFISMYIRIPHIPNRMAFIYAIHFHVYTYSSYCQPYGFYIWFFYFDVHTYSSYSQPYDFYICCSCPCTYVFLVFLTVCLLYTLFISTYIRIPRIHNRTRLCRRREFAASLRDGGNLRHRNASRRHSWFDPAANEGRENGIYVSENKSVDRLPRPLLQLGHCDLHHAWLLILSFCSEAKKAWAASSVLNIINNFRCTSIMRLIVWCIFGNQ